MHHARPIRIHTPVSSLSLGGLDFCMPRPPAFRSDATPMLSRDAKPMRIEAARERADTVWDACDEGMKGCSGQISAEPSVHNAPSQSPTCFSIGPGALASACAISCEKLERMYRSNLCDKALGMGEGFGSGTLQTRTYGNPDRERTFCSTRRLTRRHHPGHQGRRIPMTTGAGTLTRSVPWMPL